MEFSNCNEYFDVILLLFQVEKYISALVRKHETIMKSNLSILWQREEETQITREILRQ